MAETIHKIQGYIPNGNTTGITKDKFYFYTAADLVKITKNIPLISGETVQSALAGIGSTLGDISTLKTVAKTNLVEAINEAFTKPTDGGNAAKLNGKTSNDFLQLNNLTERLVGTFDKKSDAPAGSDRLNYNGYFYSTRLYGSWYNDYAEFRESLDFVKPGMVVTESSICDKVEKSRERLGILPKVVTDTFGSIIGRETKNSIPVGLSGRVLVYIENGKDSVKVGDVLCSGLNGKASIMTREEIKEFPDRILGVVSSIPDYEEWGQDSVAVNGRVWVEIK